MVSHTIGCLLGTCVKAADAKLVSCTIGCLLGACVTAAEALVVSCNCGEPHDRLPVGHLCDGG